MYPKIYLQIVVAKCIAVSKMNQWERSSPIPMNYVIDLGNDPSFSHLSYSFPNRSSVRDNIEHRCIDPSHTLANMRSQISRHGYQYCYREAFIRVSETNHDALPKSIIIDQLDRQSIRISKWFFSEEVEAILNKNGNKKEANFVHLVWYEACDERGIHIHEQLRCMEKFFRFLRGKVDWNDFPPPSKFIQGMPVQTYESIMQGIFKVLEVVMVIEMTGVVCLVISFVFVLATVILECDTCFLYFVHSLFMPVPTLFRCKHFWTIVKPTLKRLTHMC